MLNLSQENNAFASILAEKFIPEYSTQGLMTERTLKPRYPILFISLHFQTKKLRRTMVGMKAQRNDCRLRERDRLGKRIDCIAGNDLNILQATSSELNATTIAPFDEYHLRTKLRSSLVTHALPRWFLFRTQQNSEILLYSNHPLRGLYTFCTFLAFTTQLDTVCVSFSKSNCLH